jgi:VanZ family protein
MAYNMIKALDFIVLVLYFLLMYWLSVQTSMPAPMWFDFQDKLYHVGAYFVLALLVSHFLRQLISSPIIVVIVSIVFCGLFGVLEEWHQASIVGRDSDIIDWYADLFGSVSAMLFLYVLKKRAEKKGVL